jgi:hypothetical protein
MSKKTWEVGDVVGCHWFDEVIVELSNAIAMPQQKWGEAGWRFTVTAWWYTAQQRVEKKQAMSEKRAWEVGDWLVRRCDGMRGTVVATDVHVLYQTLDDGVLIGLAEKSIVAKQSVLESDGWELWKGLEQK